MLWLECDGLWNCGDWVWIGINATQHVTLATCGLPDVRIRPDMSVFLGIGQDSGVFLKKMSGSWKCHDFWWVNEILSK